MNMMEARKIMEDNQEIREFMAVAMRALERCKTKEDRQRLANHIIKMLENAVKA